MAVKVFRHMEKIGHRGAKRELPENTLPAFLRAFERGAAAVELDVHCTADRVVVVHHDPSLHDQRGQLRDIAATPWDDLQTVELANGIGIPTLADVLRHTPAGATVYVEIKGAGIEADVAEVIRSATVDCAVHSFDHEAIVRMSRIAPEIARGILFENRAADVVAEMHRTGSRDVWPNWRLIDAALVDAVHRENGRVIAWTVNDASVAAKLRALGVDGLCGDDVRLFDGL
jgi:glycerophosphoryl diester phosphodiesterase